MCATTLLVLDGPGLLSAVALAAWTLLGVGCSGDSGGSGSTDATGDALSDAIGDASSDAIGDALSDAIGDALSDAIGDASSDMTGDSHGDAETDLGAPTVVQAGGLAGATGVAEYAITVGDGAGASVALVAPGGGALGEIELLFDPGGLSATIDSPAGPITYRTDSMVGGDRLFVTQSVSVAALELRLDIMSTLDDAGIPSEETVLLRAPGDPAAVTGGAPWGGPESGLVALAVVSPDGDAPWELVAAWLGDIVPPELQNAPELLRLVIAMLDPALGEALDEAVAERAPTSPPNGLHLSATCRGLREYVHGNAGDACRRCAALDPAPRGAIPSPTPPMATLMTVLPLCRTCLVGTGVGLFDMYSCALAFFSPQDLWTDVRCAAERPTRSPGMVSYVRADGHSCLERCEPAACTAACAARGAREGLDVAPSCSGDGRTCDCGIDWTSECRARNGAAHCGEAVMTNGVASCDVARCGDGRFSATCEANPEAAEVCDPLVPDSCGGDGACADDCSACIVCECAALGATCPGGDVCDGCACAPRPSCAEAGPSAHDGDGAWCDPEQPARWCGAGVACDAESCTCAPPTPAACGDGTGDAGEECDPPGASASCASGRCAADCRCEPPCVPSCAAGQCGANADGCGGPCTCQEGQTCNAATSLCECVPACVPGTCGDERDGCGGPCFCSGAGEGCDDGTCVAMPAPSGLVATAGEARVTLTWPPFEGATAYTLYLGFDAGLTPATGAAITGVSSPYIVRGLAPELPAFFVLTAVSGGRESPPSAEASATPSRERDTTAPSVRSMTPAAGLIGVDVRAPIVVHLSEPPDPTTLDAGFSLMAGDSVVAGRRAVSGLSLLFTPNAPLQHATVYTASVTTALKDTAGNALAAPMSASFTTRPAAPGGKPTVIAGNSRVTLAWPAVTGATGYTILRADAAIGPFRAVGGSQRTTFTDRTAWNDVDYYYSVSATTPAGDSARSLEALARPSSDGLASPATVVAQPGNGEAFLAWDSSGPGCTYTLFRSTTPDGPLATFAGSVEVTGVTFRDRALTNGTRYRYVVQAKRGAKASAYSVEAAVVPSAELPASPIGLSAAVGTAGVDLEWNPVPGATSYLVYGSIDTPGVDGDGREQRPTLLAGTLTNSALLELSPGATHHLSVAAMKGNGPPGIPSEEVTATPTEWVTPSGALPSAPSNVVAKPGHGVVSLSWDVVPGAASYYVYRSAQSAGPFDTYVCNPDLAANGFDTRCSDTSPPPGTSWYAVVTYDRAGYASAPSTARAAAPSSALPSQPTIAPATPQNDQVFIEWPPAAGATRYRVHRRTAWSPWIEVGATAALSFVDTGVTNETPYYYALESERGSDRGVFSQAIGPVAPTGSVPAAPRAITAHPGKGVVTVAWDPVPGAASYYVYRADESGGPYTYVCNSALDAEGLDNRCSDTSPPNEESFYVVTSYDAGGWASGYSAEVAASPSGLLFEQVTFAQPTPGKGEVFLSWSRADRVTRYHVHRRASGSAWQEIGATSALSFVDRGVIDGTAYFYSVESDDGTHRGVFSIGHGVTPSADLPAPPTTTLHAQPGLGAVTLSWDPVPGAASYYVYRARDPGGPYDYVCNTALDAEGFDNHCTDSSAPAGESYYVVQTWEADGYSSTWSAEIPASPSPSLPATPSAWVAEGGARQLVLSWGDVPGALGYRIHRRSAGEPWSPIAQAVGATFFTDSGLTPGRTYHYALQAFSVAGAGAIGNPVSAASP